jgi:hypothetical protein
MVETLSRKAKKEHVIGNIPELQIVQGIKNINHSQFADNTLFLGGS